MTNGSPRDQFATVATATGSLQLAYQSFGKQDDPVFLLLTGWFSDMTLWPRGFCEVLADRGFRVIRYDHRDAGLSTRTDIDVIDSDNPPYTMSDLAADAVGLLDALGVEKAHVAGFAFGATISHLVAIEHPDRVLSLVPFATTTGRRTRPRRPRGTRPVFPKDPEGLGRLHKQMFADMAGASFDEEDYDARRRESAQRGAALSWGELQSAVMPTAGDRTERLGQVKVPVLVVHPEQDPLLSLEVSKLHVESFPDAKLLILEGIGHGVLPERHWAKLADAMRERTL